MISALNKSKNKDVKKIGFILSKIDKNYGRNIKGNIVVVFDRFQNTQNIDSIADIQRISISLMNKELVESLKQDLMPLRKILSNKTELNIYIPILDISENFQLKK